MERLEHFFIVEGESERKVHIVLEKRGKKEDNELELVFRRYCDTNNFPFEPVFAHKQNNSVGLQLADLVARPIGRHVINPKQDNRAYDILKKKFYRGPNGMNGWGLKIFPWQETWITLNPYARQQKTPMYSPRLVADQVFPIRVINIAIESLKYNILF